jgi:hypothetical protein
MHNIVKCFELVDILWGLCSKWQLAHHIVLPAYRVRETNMFQGREPGIILTFPKSVVEEREKDAF